MVIIMVVATIMVTIIAVMIKNITIMVIEKAVKQKKLEILRKVNVSGSLLPIEMAGIMAIVLVDIIIIATIMAEVIIMAITITTTMVVVIIMETVQIINIIIMDTMMDVEQKIKAIITKINTNGNTAVIVTAGTMVTVIVAILEL